MYRIERLLAWLHNSVTTGPRIAVLARRQKSSRLKFEFSGGTRYNNTSAVWHTNSSGFPEICTSGTIRPSPLYMRVHRRRDIYARRVGGRSLQVEGPQGLSRFPMLLVHAYIGTINRRASLSSIGLVKNSARNSKRMGKRRSGRVGRISKIIVYSGARRSTRYIIAGCSKRRVMSVNHTSCNKTAKRLPVGVSWSLESGAWQFYRAWNRNICQFYAERRADTAVSH